MSIRALAAFAAILFTFVSTSADARHRYRGACDGIHRCTCGSTQARHFGLPRMVRGHNLWQAVEWTRAFPRTAPHVGAVGYQRGGGPTGHVFRIVSYSGGCVAVVTDERGTYERNICIRGAVFVDVNGIGDFAVSRHVVRHHRRHERRQVMADAGSSYMSRMGAGL